MEAKPGGLWYWLGFTSRQQQGARAAGYEPLAEGTAVDSAGVQQSCVQSLNVSSWVLLEESEGCESKKASSI